VISILGWSLNLSSACKEWETRLSQRLVREWQTCGARALSHLLPHPTQLDVDDHCARISAIDSKSRLLRDTRSSRISKGGGQPASWRTEPIIVPSVETTTSEYSLGDQSARIKLNYAASFRFLRHPKRPSSAPPLAKSGSAAGSGVCETATSSIIGEPSPTDPVCANNSMAEPELSENAESVSVVPGF